MSDKKRAQKVNHVEHKKIHNPSELYDGFINGRLGDKRLVNRILDGRKVKPCGRECWEFGELIAMNLNHGSFINFHELMNDEEFILHIASITPNPTDCENYFYQYVNPYLKEKADFRLKFLKKVYLNENIYKLADLKLIVDWCGLEKENQIILNDKKFKLLMEERLAEIDYQEKVQYNCSGLDEKELHDYKVQANNMKILCENIRNGLKEIINAFAGEKKDIEEPKDFYAFLCDQSRKSEI